jgi:exonuclease SbcC
MSHARTVIEPAAGLTVLIGPNNCGKSAVASALETIARATRGDFMVRHGEKLCSVTVETEDGHTIAWRRKSGTVSYVIDGREVHRDVPDDLHAHLKLPLVESARGGEPFDIHFAQQKSPIFLLNEPESRAATFFSASSDAGRLLEIQDRHREKVRERKRDRVACVNEIARLEGQLSRLEGLEDAATEQAKLEVEHAELLRHTQTLAALEAMTAKIDELQKLVIDRRKRTEGFRNLTSPPNLEEIEPLARLLRDVRLTKANAARAGEESTATESLEFVPEVLDERALALAIAQLSIAQRKVMKPTETNRALGDLRDAPELIDPAVLEASCAALAKAQGDHGRMLRASRNAMDALESAEQDIRDWIAANPLCPICGGDVSMDKVLDGGHVHQELKPVRRVSVILNEVKDLAAFRKKPDSCITRDAGTQRSA